MRKWLLFVGPLLLLAGIIIIWFWLSSDESTITAAKGGEKASLPVGNVLYWALWVLGIVAAVLMVLIIIAVIAPRVRGKDIGGWQNYRWLLPLTVSGVVIVAIWGLLPGFWQWLLIKPLVLVLALLTLLATTLLVNAKLRFAWLLALLVWLAITWLAVPRDDLPSVRFWRLPLEEARKKTADEVAARTEAAREMNTRAEKARARVADQTGLRHRQSRSGEMVVIAPVGDQPTEWTTIPKSCRFEWDFVGGKGRYKIVNKLGEEWIHNYPAAGRLDLGHGSGIYSEERYTFAFVSLEERPLRFRVSWWPK